MLFLFIHFTHTILFILWHSKFISSREKKTADWNKPEQYSEIINGSLGTIFGQRK